VGGVFETSRARTRFFCLMSFPIANSNFIKQYFAVRVLGGEGFT
jgi:hypothetical protein